MCESCEATTPDTINRRKLLGWAGLTAAGAIMPFSAIAEGTGTSADAGASAGTDACTPFLAEAQAATSPDQAIQMLADGNNRFISGASLNCDLLDVARAVAPKQTPFACVLGCIDSRAAPEVVFDQQLGDLFVARVAGNVPTAEIIGSFEYAAKVAGAKAIVVVGHNHCGAVKGAIDRAKVGTNLTVLLNEIEPAVATTPLEGERSSENHEFVEAVAETNVRMSVKALTERSPVLAELVASGALKVVGALYDIETGRITFLPSEEA